MNPQYKLTVSSLYFPTQLDCVYSASFCCSCVVLLVKGETMLEECLLGSVSVCGTHTHSLP